MQMLSPAILLLFALIGSCGGFLAGLLGIGGGIVFIPIFLWLFPLAGFSPELVAHLAFGTSLALIIPTAISSTLAHRKNGNVDWHQVYRISLGSAFGAVAGASLAAILSGDRLKMLFGLMQVLVGLRLFFQPRHLPPERQTAVPFWQLLLVGCAVGAFSAFFGVGGGVIAVPLMVMLLQLPTRTAVGNSSAMIVVSAFFGVFSYMLHGWAAPDLPPFSIGYVNFLVVAIMAPFAIFGAGFGVRVASRVAHDTLLRIFALLLIFVGTRILVRNIF